ncbi:S46 family peptidase [Prevotella sp. OH937_COT-195]|uniref:S46 family peptidase n=1 Tax=Prevotella sp. OH937_COT-195 TaxID=2491051 RepID=UPI000F652F78|nr:S46 family peptidase [Prevotella sp. OH937_COT-195]RRC98714.1 S46 family peptidase [Prevotella sp. OH937_COT-195]
MKKLLLLISMVTVFSWQQARADEGMWTLYNLPWAVYEQMKAEGFEMPYNALYKGEGALKDCVVNFSGFCSGVVVSPDGLVFTNHHCGFESIRSHSTVEHDYMLNGFYAKTYAEELPNENMFVSFMIDQCDITDRINAIAKAKGIEESKWDEIIDSLENVMNDSVKNIDKTYHLEIAAFYERNKYYATTYQMFSDLRLVFTIPKSMGKFGGETDNWMYPRQTCDFAVFRIYADPKTNGPAKYSAENVPYRPKRWAKVSMDGYKEGDFAMTIGYPGSTNRYLSSFGIQERRDAENAVRVQVRGVKQQIMKRHMDASEAVRIKYDSKYAQSSNYWKNSIGMNKCIDSVGIVNLKRGHEAKIRDFQEKTGFLKGELDIDELGRLYKKRFETKRAMTYFFETFYRSNELVSRSLKVNSMHVEMQGSDDKPEKQYCVLADNSKEWDAPLDKEVLAALLKNYRGHVQEKYLPEFYATIDKKFGGDYAKYVDFLYKKSVLMKNGKKLYVNKKNFHKDLAVSMGIDILAELAVMSAEISDINEKIDRQEKLLCAAKLRMEEDMPHYSDANFTMRLSYGQVGGFMLNGSPTGYYTTAESILEKMKRANEVPDYYAEPIMHELFSKTDYTPYSDKTTGKMQLCFLTNNDITGGNSGSPMFNGKGELIGLAFDGNWDSLSSDIYFDTELARCIGADIRYVLYMMDKWGHADRLLKEINAQ